MQPLIAVLAARDNTPLEEETSAQEGFPWMKDSQD
jgi:hypothetical protein